MKIAIAILALFIACTASREQGVGGPYVSREQGVGGPHIGREQGVGGPHVSLGQAVGGSRRILVENVVGSGRRLNRGLKEVQQHRLLEEELRRLI